MFAALLSCRSGAQQPSPQGGQPFAYRHSERSEESLLVAQGRLREESLRSLKGRPTSIRKQQLIVGRDTVLVEVAATEEMRAVGLMYRTVMAEDEGMLFAFETEGIYPFWMKNTVLPLSIAFIDRNGAIVDIQDMTPHDEITHHAPRVPVLYALEMNQGWFRTHQVNAGDKVQLLPGRPQGNSNNSEHRTQGTARTNSEQRTLNAERRTLRTVLRSVLCVLHSALSGSLSVLPSEFVGS